METVTPGYKTTEFWLSLAAVLVGTLFSAGILVEGTLAFKVVSLIATILTAMGYTVVRMQVKRAALLKETLSSPLSKG